MNWLMSPSLFNPFPYARCKWHYLPLRKQKRKHSIIMNIWDQIFTIMSFCCNEWNVRNHVLNMQRLKWKVSFSVVNKKVSRCCLTVLGKRRQRSDHTLPPLKFPKHLWYFVVVGSWDIWLLFFKETLMLAFFLVFNSLYLFWLLRVLVAAHRIFVAARQIFRCSAWAPLWLWRTGLSLVVARRLQSAWAQ